MVCYYYILKVNEIDMDAAHRKHRHMHQHTA